MMNKNKEYIEREALIEKIKANINTLDQFCSLYTNQSARALEHLAKEILELPAADVELVRHGRWIETGEYTATGKHLFVCSACHKEDSWVVNRKKYCSECGAKMDEEE